MSTTTATVVATVQPVLGLRCRNRRGRPVQVLHQVKCGWFEVFQLDNQVCYYVNEVGQHRHDRGLDLVDPNDPATCVGRGVDTAKTTPHKPRRRTVKVGKYAFDPGDDVDTTQPITKRIGKWIRYGRDWKYSELEVTVVEDEIGGETAPRQPVRSGSGPR